MQRPQMRPGMMAAQQQAGLSQQQIRMGGRPPGQPGNYAHPSQASQPPQQQPGKIFFTFKTLLFQNNKSAISGVGAPSQQQSSNRGPPTQVSPQLSSSQPPRSRANATNDKIEKARFATKEAEYETKFSNRFEFFLDFFFFYNCFQTFSYKDASFQTKEKMPEPYIWVNMPSQNSKNDNRNRNRDNKKGGRKNNDDYYRERESRERYR